jgi:hypothetical protein
VPYAWSGFIATGVGRPAFHLNRIGPAHAPQEIPMVNLALTMLPIIVTFAVAAWHSPADEVQPRSALSSNPIDAACRNCLS